MSQTYYRDIARRWLLTLLDLNDFTTLYYYNIAYNLFTLRQSSRRSWRINQKAPKVEVYFTYYEGTMQHRAIRLMASKLAVAGIIEGNFTDEGLAAMSDCADMTTALARELTQGIRNEVEDLSSVFKKMAKLKSSDDSEQLDIGEIGSIDTEFTVWDESSTTAAVDAEAELWPISSEVVTDTNVEVTDVSYTEDASEEEAPADIVAVVPPVANFYAPHQEDIEKNAILQRFQQFKATFNSSNIPNHVLLEMLETMFRTDSPIPVAVGIPDDFDPFADEAA